MHINFVKHLDQAIFGSLLVMVLSIPLSESIKSVFFVIALLCWTAKMTVQHLFLITVTGLSGIALIFTYTRSMWMIVILVMILAAVLSRAWWPVMAAIVLTASLGISATMSPMIQNRIVHLANPLTDQSLAGRFAIWEGALKMFEESPVLGVGSKCFKPNRDQYGIPEYGGQAHNLLIHVSAELGSVGVMTLLAWLGAYLHFLIRFGKFFNHSDWRDRWSDDWI